MADINNYTVGVSDVHASGVGLRQRRGRIVANLRPVRNIIRDHGVTEMTTPPGCSAAGVNQW